MAHLTDPTGMVGPTGWAQGRAATPFAGARWLAPGTSLRDLRFVGGATGTIATNNRVYYKDDGGPETPFAGARVRLHRLADGYCAWEGWSDAAGYYHASHLETGLMYYPVAIDPTGTYECVAAGPVLAEAGT